MIYDEIVLKLKSLADPAAVEGMARFGISTVNTLGISLYVLKPLARQIGRDHVLAQQLWESGIHEARMLAGMVDEPGKVTEAQMESWVVDFESWDICDQCCSNLFDKTPFAYTKVEEWSARKEEFVKRAGFVLMACLAVHDKKAPNERFIAFLPVIIRESGDDRNFVKKAVNWALRQIGKRNCELNEAAVETAREIRELGTRSGKWIAADALRELTGQAVQNRLEKLSVR
jgi:3-methyladenine DNA glycosylase AlkD